MNAFHILGLHDIHGFTIVRMRMLMCHTKFIVTILAGESYQFKFLVTMGASFFNDRFFNIFRFHFTTLIILLIVILNQIYIFYNIHGHWNLMKLSLDITRLIVFGDESGIFLIGSGDLDFLTSFSF